MTRTAFAPAPQGCLQKALGTPGQLNKIGPQSPRPVELLGSLTVTGGGNLTAKDAALSELLISSAYEGDRSMNLDTTSIPMAFVLRYLGEDTRREHVRASLNRLKSTLVTFKVGDEEYQDVPLLTSWLRKSDAGDAVFYSLPEPIRVVMSDRSRYAYIELAALPTMSSSYSARLYRRLVAAVTESKRTWVPGGDNAVVVEATPEEVADWVCFPRTRDGGLHVGKLRERVLSGLAEDFAALQNFSFSMTTFAGAGRGRPLEKIAFRMELTAPSRFKSRLVYAADDMRFVGGTDLKELRVNSSVWLKAERQFLAPGRKPLSRRDWWNLWLAAIDEMQSGVPHTRECEMRVFRGEGLRAKIALLSADSAAWGFCAEEADAPDLCLRDIEKLGAAGREARDARLGRPAVGEANDPAECSEEAPVAAQSVAHASSNDVAFDEATEIHLTVDPALSPQEQDDMVFDPLAGFEFLGSTSKKIVVHFQRKGHWDSYTREDRPTEDCIFALMQKIGRHIDGIQEYRR